MRKAQKDCLSRVAGRMPLPYILAAAGMGSRSQCRGMVRGGRIVVNTRIVRDAQFQADPFRDTVLVDGQPLNLDHTCRYVLLNKPYGVLCAFTDPDHDRRGSQQRPTLADYVPVPDIYPAGRLDLDSEGLLLLTDDGWLIHHLSHPRYHQPKTYLVQVEGEPGESAVKQLVRGVTVKGRRAVAVGAERLSIEPDLPPRSVPIRYRKSVPTAWLRVVLAEGRKRQVRRMTAAVGHPTLRLVRVAIGPLLVGILKPGEWRELTSSELNHLYRLFHPPRR